jgi:hypothetical protein
MSLGVITSRKSKSWPKVHWVVRKEVIEHKGHAIVVLKEDYELVWPWMKCIAIGIHKGG